MPDRTSIPEKRQVRQHGLFRSFGCKGVWYEFSPAPDAFDVRRFAEASQLQNASSRWAAVCAPKSPLTDYHVHFDGRASTKHISFRVYYAEDAVRPASDEREPYAESIMAWLGSFFKSPIASVDVTASFEKPDSRWRGQFNLPFKVTMSGQHTEVVIDGIMMALPRSPSGAYEGTLKRKPGKFSTSVKLNRKVEFAKFNLRDEIKIFHDATKLWIEEKG